MRFLGIDYGTKRIGLAVGDDETDFAFPLTTIAGATDEEAIAAITTHAAKEGAAAIVVGMPNRMSGESEVKGETVVLVENFVAALKAKTSLPVETEDERMTSAYVERIRQDSATKKKDFDKDAIAAAAILDTYLMRKRNAAT